MSGPKAEARVVISKDGPYVVTGNVPLATQTIVTDHDGGSELWKQGEPIRAQEKYSLCRCGQSKKRPFCDGAHAKVGFDGAETASREPYVDQAKVLDGPTMALMDAEQLCAFGRFCDPHGKVWDQVGRTDDPDVRAMFIRQVGNCPAGRLVAWDKETGKALEPHLPVSIGLVEDPPEGCSGPLWLRGGVAVISADGFEYEIRNRATRGSDRTAWRDRLAAHQRRLRYGRRRLRQDLTGNSIQADNTDFRTLQASWGSKGGQYLES